MNKLIKDYKSKMNMIHTIKVLGLSWFIFLFLLFFIGLVYCLYNYTIITSIIVISLIGGVFIYDFIRLYIEKKRTS